MKSFKVLIAAVALSVATAPLTQAQEKKGRGNMSPEQRIERLETAVGTLTAEQKKKITDIYTKASEKAREAAGDREKMGEIMQAAGKEVRAVLTPDQQKKFDEMPQGGRGGGGGKKQN
jgi:Spy/CpxP family protein refolding chaperone